MNRTRWTRPGSQSHRKNRIRWIRPSCRRRIDHGQWSRNAHRLLDRDGRHHRTNHGDHPSRDGGYEVA
jgi:hypothetical protein